MRSELKQFHCILIILKIANRYTVHDNMQEILPGSANLLFPLGRAFALVSFIDFIKSFSTFL